MGQFFLEVVFDDGKKCIYNVEEDINQIKSYENLRDIQDYFSRSDWIRAEPVFIGMIV